MWNVYIYLDISINFVEAVFEDFEIGIMNYIKTNNLLSMTVRADRAPLKEALKKIVKIFGCDIEINKASDS